MHLEIKNPVFSLIETVLRDKESKPHQIRLFLRQAGFLLAYEIINRELETKDKIIQTPLKQFNGKEIKDSLLLIDILRAAIPFTEGFLDLIDFFRIKREIGIVDAKRVEVSTLDFKVEMPSFKVPSPAGKITIICDPMLATATTLIETIKKLKDLGIPKKLIVASVIAAPYGIKKLESLFPEIIIYSFSIDKEGKYDGLNEHGYIVPGLGDAGDRVFGSY